MKNVTLKILVLLLVCSGLFMINSCEKGQPDYKVEVTVKYDGDTNLVVPGAWVRVGKNDIFSILTSNNQGKALFTFEKEAIMDVEAATDTSAGPDSLYGRTLVRLEADKTVHRSVFIAKRP